jgi:hypothetical protein
MRSKRAYEGGVDAMFIWTIVALIPLALLGSALLASKAGARRDNRNRQVWSATEVDYKARNEPIPTLEEVLKGLYLPLERGFRTGHSGACRRPHRQSNRRDKRCGAEPR